MLGKLVTFGVLAITLVGIFVFRSGPNLSVGEIIVGEAKVIVEVAETPEARERGLGGRRALPEGRGMLFVFKAPGRHAFWMKDMRFPIDIVFIGADRRVTEVVRDLRPESYPATYVPLQEALYVLEVPANWTTRNRTEPGDEARLGGIGNVVLE